MGVVKYGDVRLISGQHEPPLPSLPSNPSLCVVTASVMQPPNQYSPSCHADVVRLKDGTTVASIRLCLKKGKKRKSIVQERGRLNKPLILGSGISYVPTTPTFHRITSGRNERKEMQSKCGSKHKPAGKRTRNQRRTPLQIKFNEIMRLKNHTEGCNKFPIYMHTTRLNTE